jgi:hypothetical protein
MTEPVKDVSPTATTTAEQDKHSAGQRQINRIWEITQALIAGGVIGSVLYASVVITLRSDMDKTAFIFLTNIAFTIVGFYFGRTNHQKVGGVDVGR